MQWAWGQQKGPGQKIDLFIFLLGCAPIHALPMPLGASESKERCLMRFWRKDMVERHKTF